MDIFKDKIIFSTYFCKQQPLNTNSSLQQIDSATIISRSDKRVIKI